MTAAIFIDGAIFALLVVIALFHLRFWRRTRDRLFAGFALGFAVLAVNRVALTATTDSDDGEVRTYLYVVRLVAFLAILVAIADKNRRSRREPAVGATPTSSDR